MQEVLDDEETARMRALQDSLLPSMSDELREELEAIFT